MVKTYDIDLEKKDFESLAKGLPYVITEDKGFNVGDFILFREFEIVKPSDLKIDGQPMMLDEPAPGVPEQEATKDTGLYSMTMVDNVIHASGLKEGFVLLTIVRM